LFFLLTAIVTGQLAADQRGRAREAKEREREAVILYEVVRLLGEPNLDEMLHLVSERLRSELRLQALTVELTQPGGEVTRFTAGDDAAATTTAASSRVLQTTPLDPTSSDPRPARWIRLVQPARSSRQDADVRLWPIKAGQRR